ncbi:TetR/AcrR family transcriptional regulator [Streptomyces sp. NPDC058301]|uniref:TetR/AcrR family transcriptional regulator n=1 Tax=Streptomyces sp. NPDC058301 TaxID=3346436 RepID=UPI0036E44F0A
MGIPRKSRRERLRAHTTSQIKATALDHLAGGGSGAVSLRAIAREMGMTAGAIYSYFDTREALITALIADLHTALADRLEAACGRAPGDGPAAAVFALGHSYREWGIANPRHFHLIHGHPADPGQEVPEAAHRVPVLLTGLVAACLRLRGAPEPAAGRLPYDWGDFEPGYVVRVRAAHPDASPAALAGALRLWGRMQGLVSLEVYGHLGAQTRRPAKLFHAEMRHSLRAFGAC